ncbi:MAG: RpiB/LacA/LacB family sugar-phosphate isomerase [Patescibacteria group bacterium]
MIYLGADHGGFELKEKIKQWLTKWGYQIEDLGAKEHIPGDDYPQYAFSVAEKVSQNDDDTLPWQKRVKGILACRSAGGMVIAANKLKNIRAVAIADTEEASLAREKNDANIIVLAGDYISEDQAQEIIRKWLDTEFSNEPRHVRRLNQIRERENKHECECGGGCV